MSSRQKSHKGTSCHQCKSIKPASKLTFCTNSFEKRTKPGQRLCRKKYCDTCLQKFYSRYASEGVRSWICASCRGVCTCAACVRQNRGPTGNAAEDDEDEAQAERPRGRKPAHARKITASHAHQGLEPNHGPGSAQPLDLNDALQLQAQHQYAGSGGPAADPIDIQALREQILAAVHAQAQSGQLGNSGSATDPGAGVLAALQALGLGGLANIVTAQAHAVSAAQAQAAAHAHAAGATPTHAPMHVPGSTAGTTRAYQPPNYEIEHFRAPGVGAPRGFALPEESSLADVSALLRHEFEASQRHNYPQQQPQQPQYQQYPQYQQQYQPAPVPGPPVVNAGGTGGAVNSGLVFPPHGLGSGVPGSGAPQMAIGSDPAWSSGSPARNPEAMFGNTPGLSPRTLVSSVSGASTSALPLGLDAASNPTMQGKIGAATAAGRGRAFSFMDTPSPQPHTVLFSGAASQPAMSQFAVETTPVPQSSPSSGSLSMFSPLGTLGRSLPTLPTSGPLSSRALFSNSLPFSPVMQTLAMDLTSPSLAGRELAGSGPGLGTSDILGSRRLLDSPAPSPAILARHYASAARSGGLGSPLRTPPQQVLELVARAQPYSRYSDELDPSPAGAVERRLDSYQRAAAQGLAPGSESAPAALGGRGAPGPGAGSGAANGTGKAGVPGAKRFDHGKPPMPTPRSPAFLLERLRLHDPQRQTQTRQAFKPEEVAAANARLVDLERQTQGFVPSASPSRSPQFDYQPRSMSGGHGGLNIDVLGPSSGAGSGFMPLSPMSPLRMRMASNVPALTDLPTF